MAYTNLKVCKKALAASLESSWKEKVRELFAVNALKGDVARTQILLG